ncbi:MAG: dihydropteroate synthase [Euryarchaeota archaeon RBG_16_68_13]|nr:MAG: dihydropteroate synthase [Euryarchaeota archaeon RBG_16_68_13]
MARIARRWLHRTGEIVLDRTRIMGVLNVTPDSFSDGGRYLDPGDAVHRGLEMVEQGADLVDIGGESTRPGSVAVPPEEEWRRVGPVLEGLSRRVDAPLSVDTRRPVIAERALASGASIVNDVSGLRDPQMIRLLARSRAGAVVMHTLGDPGTMQENPAYRDVLGEVRGFLEGRVRVALAEGVPRESMAVDPGIGFGKSLDHNLELLRHLDVLADLGQTVVIGVSRKSFLGRIGGADPGGRLPEGLAAATFAALQGAHVVRTHDVAETAKAMRVVDALRPRS